MEGNESGRVSRVMFAVGGPVVIGAILGLPHAPEGIGRGALVIPAILLGVGLATLPALYIGCSLAGVAPPARDVATAALRAARNGGVVFAGLALPLAFLIASASGGGVVPVLGMMAISVGGFAALRAIWRDLFAIDPSRRARQDAGAIFGVWAVLALAIGGRLLVENL